MSAHEVSPYRFTVSVESYEAMTQEHKTERRWLAVVKSGIPGECVVADVTAEFPTEAEARSHAALVLAALHQATIEGDAS